MVKTDLNTFSSLVNKYGVEKVAKANKVEELYQDQQKDAKGEEFIRVMDATVFNPKAYIPILMMFLIGIVSIIFFKTSEFMGIQIQPFKVLGWYKMREESKW